MVYIAEHIQQQERGLAVLPMRLRRRSGETRNSLQMTSWFTSKSCARAETIIASAQMPSGRRPVAIQSFFRRVMMRRAVATTEARDSPIQYTIRIVELYG